MKTLLNLCIFCMCLSMTAQQRLEKISQSINVNDEVVIDLNTSYTNLVIDTWNKDIIEVEAYIESDKLSKEELNEVLKDWKISVDGSKDQVSITTEGMYGSWNNRLVYFDDESSDALRILEMELARVPELVVAPTLEGLSDMPPMPKMPKLPKLPKGLNEFQFDYDKYQKEGEAYMEEWSKEYGEKYGDEYAKKMEEWAKKWEESPEMKEFEKSMEEWGEKFGKEFGEKFGKDMEKWGEQFGKDMERWGEQFGRQMEQQAHRLEQREALRQQRIHEREKMQVEREKMQEERQKMREKSRNYKLRHVGPDSQGVIKTIRIKIPKKAKLNMNVRHGELKFASNIQDLKADLTYTALVANSIDGSKTSINASYSPVKINQWLAGELKLKYVDDAQINQVKQLVLSSNSSNIILDKLSGSAIIDGSFGDLVISDIDPGFQNINIVLENSDALISLPQTNYNLQFKGKNSSFKHPKSAKNDLVSSFSTGDLGSGKTIVVNAKFSQVVMK